MSVRLWIETVYHPAFRHGGWGFARETAGAVSGSAGGERNTTAARIDLMALIAALQGLPEGASVAVLTSSPSLLAAGRLIQTPPAPQDAPTEDLDLWAQVLKAAAGRSVSFKATLRAPQTPAAFCFAWAEVGQDKAKGQGRFSAVIPKSNLAKLKLD